MIPTQTALAQAGTKESIPGVATILAGDGPSTGETRSGVGQNSTAIEAHEILPPGAIAASPTIKTTPLTDGFEGSFPGSIWQLYHDPSGPDVEWGQSPYRASVGSYSIWCAGSGSAAPPSGGDVPVNTESWAIAGPFDLTGATWGELKFDLWLVTETESDHFKWLASTNGTSFSGLQVSGSPGFFQTMTQDLSDWGGAGNLLGRSQVWIAFVYQSDESNTYEGAYVDEVSLTTNQISQTEREALIAFYNALDGPNWTSNRNWLGPFGTECTWQGIYCDGSHVVEVGRDSSLNSNNMSGSVPPEIEDLTELQHLVLTGNSISGLPDEIGNLPNLSGLDLRRNQLSSLPPTIGNLSGLSSMNVSGNHLSSLPSTIGNLSALSGFDASDNLLTTVPSGIGNLADLRVLFLANNDLSTLPAEIGDLANLLELKLNGNSLTSLPSEFVNLTSLRDLYLNDNELTSLPAGFGDLTDLLHLFLENNVLTSLPDGFGGFPTMEFLYLHNNLLTGLPEDFGGMPILTYLTLTNNSLVALPPSIGNLPSLQRLQLSENQLSTLPPEIGNLESLEWFYLEDNQISSLPTGMSGMTNLERLYLSGNRLSSLPDDFSDFTSLFDLSLNENEFTSFPMEVIEGSSLLAVDLADNHLTAIPPEIGTSSITSLDLTGNRLNSLPIEIMNSVTGQLDIDWNAIKAEDPALWWYLYNFSPIWTVSQTISPDALEYERISDRTAMMSWWPIDYTFDPGGYEVLYRESGSGTWLSAGWTPSKFVTQFPVTNLDPATSYEVAVRSFTFPHLFNENYVESLESQPVSATTSDFGCASPVITTEGVGPFTLTSSGGDSYHWSTGETSESIAVNPSDETWYWVTTTVGGCEESATAIVATSGIFDDGFQTGDASAWSSMAP